MPDDEKKFICPQCGFVKDSGFNCPRCEEIGRANTMQPSSTGQVGEFKSLVQGFAPKTGFPMSRDFAYQEVNCGATNCVANHASKCTCPSLISLNVNHRCLGYQDRNAKTKTKKSK